MKDESSNSSNSMNTYEELLDEIDINYMIGYIEEQLLCVFILIIHIYLSKEV